MPFFDDSGPRVEQEDNPLWRSFALVRDQLERMILLNLLWIVQGVPLLVAWAFPVPEGVRLLCTLYSVLAFPPITATLFALVRQVSEGEAINGYLVADSFRQQFWPGLLKLMPLYSLFFWLAALASLSAEQGWFVLDVSARLLFLLLLPISLYFGALLIAHPEWSVLQLFLHAVNLTWRFPERTLMLGGASLAACTLGFISIAGIVLIAPILIILFQTEYLRAIELRHPWKV